MSVISQNDDQQSDGDDNAPSQFGFQENASSPYKETTYVQRSFNINPSKAHYIGGAVLIVIIVICIIVSACNITSTDVKKYNAKLGIEHLVISDSNRLWTFDVHTKKQTVYLTANNDILAFDTFLDEAIFWREKNTSHIASLNCGNVTHTNKINPQAMALDYVTEKLYLLDKPSGTLMIVDMKSNYYGVMISSLQNPHDIALDIAEGLMFISLSNEAIIRANMDGTSLHRIVEGLSISAITLDRKALKIFWANDLTSIESSDYDGKNRQTVTKVPMGIASLALYENQLYWTRSYNWSDICPCTNVLWTCAMHRRSCKNVTSYRLEFDGPRTVRTSYDQHRHLIKNPCERANGGCEHLCLMTSRGSHECACQIGWKLNNDGKTCSNVTDLLVYVQGNYVRARILDESEKSREAFTDAIVPTRYTTESMKLKLLIHFDYDMISGEFFFSDDHGIHRLNLLNDTEQTRILNVSKEFKIRELAYDWLKGNMYYVREAQDPAGNHSIVAFNVVAGPSAGQRQVLTTRYKKEHYIDCPFFLLVNPSHEYLFYTEFSGISDNLRRVGTNGKGLVLIKPLYDYMYNLLALDLVRSRLYWTTMSDPSLVKSANFDGSEERPVQLREMDKPTFLGVHGEWIYVGNYSEIFRVRDETGDLATQLDNVKLRYENNVPEYLHGLGVYSLAARNAN